MIDDNSKEVDPILNLINDLKGNLYSSVNISMKIAWILMNNRGSGQVATNLICLLWLIELDSCKNMDDVEKLKDKIKRIREPYSVT